MHKGLSPTVLVFRYGQLGDTLVALPAYWALREAFPNARLTLLSEVPRNARHLGPERILPPRGLFDDFRRFETAAGGRSPLSIVRMAWALRRECYDLLVYLAPRLRVNPNAAARDLRFFRFAGLRNVIGQHGTEPIPPKVEGQRLPVVRSESEDLLARLAAGGISGPARNGDWLALSSDERSKAGSWLEAAGVPTAARSRCLAIGPGSKWPSKVWPEERFAEAGCELIRRYDLIPVVFGGPEDADVGRRLCQAWGRGIVAAGELDVRSAVAAMEGMAGYLGNDTGTMHMAAVAGLRCVGLFTATDWPGKWEPIGGPHTMLRTQPDCEGCRLAECPHGNRCLTDVGVAEVLEAVSPLVNGPASRAK